MATAKRRSPRSARKRPGGPAAAERRRVTGELRALAHPLRLRLLEQFARGACTTMQVAARLGEPPTRLYHHVNALERAGLLKLKTTRQNRGTTEKYYEVARMRMGISDPASLRGDTLRTVRGLATQVIEEARRELLAAVAAPAAGPAARNKRTGSATNAASPRPLPLAARVVLSVPAERHAAFRRRLVESLQAMGREFGSKSPAEARSLALTFVLAPTLAPGNALTEGAQPPRGPKPLPRAQGSRRP